MKMLIEIHEETHEKQTDDTVGAKGDVGAEIRREKAAEQRATASSETKMKALQNTLTRETETFWSSLREIRAGRRPNSSMRQSFKEKNFFARSLIEERSLRSYLG